MIHKIVLLAFLCNFIESTYSVWVTVNTPSYPTIPEAPLNPLLLNILANKFVQDIVVTSDPDFVFIYLPILCFEALSNPLVKATLNCTVDEIYGILYFSGYWGGIWLRHLLQNRPSAADPNFVKLSVSTKINDAINAATGSNPLSYTSGQLAAAVGSFGYNAGYCKTIITNHPTGVSPNPIWDFTYNPNAALNATFVTPLLNLDWVDRFWFYKLNTDSDYSGLKQTCLSIQSASYQQGVNTWSSPSPLNVQGFSAANYNTLLKASTGFLEIAQFVALQITKSIGFQSQPLAKYAAYDNGAFLTFNGAYSVGLFNGVYDNAAYQFPAIQ